MNINKIEIEKLWYTLQMLKSDKVKYKQAFLYFLLKNTKILDSEISIITEIKKNSVPPKEYLEYENKKNELIEIYSKKDQDGKPVNYNIDGRLVYDMGENVGRFNESINSLRETYNEAIKTVEGMNRSLTDFMNTEVDVNLVKIDSSDVPQEMMFEYFEVLEPLIINKEEGSND